MHSIYKSFFKNEEIKKKKLQNEWRKKNFRRKWDAFSSMCFIFHSSAAATTEKQISYNQSRKSITLIEVDIHKFSHFSCCPDKNESQTEVKEEEEEKKMIELSETMK